MKWPALSDPATYVPLLVAGLSFPLYAVERDYSAPGGSGEVSRILPTLLYGLMFLAALGYTRVGSFAAGLKLYRIDLLIMGFLVVSLLQAGYTGNTTQMLNVGLLIVAALGIRAASQSPQFQRRLVQSSMVLLVFQVLAFVILGPPQYRWLGGIHPNILGGVSVACVALALFGSRRYLDLATIVSLAASLAVSSRYAMLCIGVTYVLYQLLNLRSVGRLRWTVLGLLVAAVFIDVLVNGVNSQLGAAFELDDAARGLGSGLTGRDERWALFWPQLEERPLLGFGFRNRAEYEGVHNGYLTTILENGLLGAGLLFGYCLARALQEARAALLASAAGGRGASFCMLLALGVGALFQPQLLSFGDCFGFSLLLILFSRPGFAVSPRTVAVVDMPPPFVAAPPGLRGEIS